VLINGATGFTGSIAVQLAKYYGAAKVIATGRNEAALQDLKTIGADELISLQRDDNKIIAQLKELHKSSPIDIVIDYLWGHSAELILEALKAKGAFTHKVSYVSVGAVTGDTISLSSSVLRSTDLQISGSGLGSWSEEEIKILITEILPETFELAGAGKLLVNVETAFMKDIDSIWNGNVANGKRLVVMI